MREPIQVDEPHFDADGLTRVEFRFERPGQEDFHVEIGKTGDHSNSPHWLRYAAKSAKGVARIAGGKA